jgi:hypothetical protein
MDSSSTFLALLKPLFDDYHVAMVPASESELSLFTIRAKEHDVPSDVILQLIDFYSVVDGIPCLDSLDIRPCSDMTIFEWWQYKELWLGQRDFCTLRWTKGRYCIGDASNVSFSPSDEYVTFAEALNHIVRLSI